MEGLDPSAWSERSSQGNIMKSVYGPLVARKKTALQKQIESMSAVTYEDGREALIQFSALPGFF